MSEPTPISNLTDTIITTCALAMAGADFEHAMRMASSAHRRDDFQLWIALRVTKLAALGPAEIIARWPRAGFPAARCPDVDLLARAELAQELWLLREILKRPSATADTEPPR